MFDITTTKQVIRNRFRRKSHKSTAPADYEVMIIGAGIAGIGMACRLQQQQHKNLFGHKSSK